MQPNQFTISQQKFHQRKMCGIAGLILSILYLGLTLYLFFTNQFNDPTIFYIKIGLVIIFSIFSIRLAFRKFKQIYLIVREENIEWFDAELIDQPISINWSNLRWIKKEKNDSVSFNQISSTTLNISIARFSDLDKIQIGQLLKEFALRNQVRLIDFE